MIVIFFYTTVCVAPFLRVSPARILTAQSTAYKPSQVLTDTSVLESFRVALRQCLINSFVSRSAAARTSLQFVVKPRALSTRSRVSYR